MKDKKKCTIQKSNKRAVSVIVRKTYNTIVIAGNKVAWWYLAAPLLSWVALLEHWCFDLNLPCEAIKRLITPPLENKNMAWLFDFCRDDTRNRKTNVSNTCHGTPRYIALGFWCNIDNLGHLGWFEFQTMHFLLSYMLTCIHITKPKCIHVCVPGSGTFSCYNCNRPYIIGETNTSFIFSNEYRIAFHFRLKSKSAIKFYNL